MMIYIGGIIQMLITFDYDKHYQRLIDRFNSGKINPEKMDQLIISLDDWNKNLL
jgi:threonine dehydrogenase-like Zn-dependent dehydrogenase